MVYPSTSSGYPCITINAKILNPAVKQYSFHFKPIQCFQDQSSNTISKSTKPRINLKYFTFQTSKEAYFYKKSNKNRAYEEKRVISQVGSEEMSVLCGFGYWVQGFRCFPWLALNFHMAHNLNLHPSTLQLVQSAGNFPMVAKPLYGIISDALYIGGSHRIPYICIGVILQVLAWGPLSLSPVTRQFLPTLMACVLLSNFGASITEVANDALIAEYGQKHNMNSLQSYAYMASAAGGILGNLIGGCLLMKTPPRVMFLAFSILLCLQLLNSLRTKEESLGLGQPSSNNLSKTSMVESIRTKFSDLMVAISEESIFRPLAWVVASISMVPVLSGSIFCYQTQCLHLDPSVIGMSRVIGQLMILSMTVLYDRCWKKVPMRKLVYVLQILYAGLVLLDLVLVRQINLMWGISNEVFALCFSSLAECVAQFKLLPFSVLFANLCPQGCEGSLTSFLASALCLSSIISGFLGVGLASLVGITSCDYSSLAVGIVVQFVAALVPILWIHHLPKSQGIALLKLASGLLTRDRHSIGNEFVKKFVSCFTYSNPPPRDSIWDCFQLKRIPSLNYRRSEERTMTGEENGNRQRWSEDSTPVDSHWWKRGVDGEKVVVGL